jgi:DNA-binding transcriptional MerR regulator
MQTFTIRDIEHLTGIRAHTLRIWEQRYGLFEPKRKESQHRFYDNEDLKSLLRISLLYHQGMKISRIAALAEQDIISLVKTYADEAGNYEAHINELLGAAVSFNAREFSGTISRVIEKSGFENTVIHVFYPYLKKIGLLWSTNHVIPAQEHFSSYLIQNRVIVETEKLSAPARPPEIVLGCPVGEYHELPLLFIHYLLRKNGWSSIYLGANIKKEEISLVAALPSVTHIYLHLITNFTGMDADDYFEDLSRRFPERRIVISGEGCSQLQRSFLNLRVLRTDQQIHQFISEPITT